MKKLGLIVKNFIPTLKKYIDYLMKVGYKDLFINTVIIFCLFALSAFVYIPIGVVKNTISDTIQLLGGMSNIISQIYYWLFNIVSAICAIFVFMWLFNKRFASIENNVSSEEKDPIKKEKHVEVKEEDFSLPKAKNK